MDSTASPLPAVYAEAANALKTVFSGTPLPPAAPGGAQKLPEGMEVRVSKGYQVQTWKENAGNDTLQITIKSPGMTSSEYADAVGKSALEALNKIDAVRAHAILVSPKEYNSQVKDELGSLQQAARDAHVDGGRHINLRDTDLTQWKGFDNSYSQNQIPDHAVQLVENAAMTQIRVNIPTNPDNRAEAMASADKVAADLRRRLPDIKAGMIQRVLEKNYNSKTLNDPQYTADWTKQMEAHTFDVTTQQQANWTSVFINISSPEQKKAQASPGAPFDPNLPGSNFLSQVDEKHRLKLAARATLFEGKGLKKPAPIFTDVAGAKDMENLLAKSMHYLTDARPDLKPRAEALLKENLFKRREQWNIAPERQDEYKHAVRAGISPDLPDTMKITLSLPKGTAEEVVTAIAALRDAHHGSTGIDTATLNNLADKLITTGDTLSRLGSGAELAAAGATTQLGKVVAIPALDRSSPLGRLASSVAIAGAGISRA